jgi:1-phosphofructokinase family hexose kinase
MIVCVTPNPALDYTLTVPQFHSGQIMRATHKRVTAGGKGLNVARAIRTLDGQAICLGLLGGHSGQLLADLAKQEGLNGDWISISAETRTCVIVVSADGGEATVINEAGPTVSVADWAKLKANVLRSTHADIVSFSGSLPVGLPAEEWREMLFEVRSAGPTVWVDTSGDALRVALQLGGLNIKVNHQEACALLDYKIDDIESAAKAATELRSSGASTIVVTLGENGAVLADAAGAIHAPAPRVKAINSVGSGDSFLGGLLFAISNRASSAEALRWGVAAGTANAICSGGGHFTIEAFQKVLSRTVSA